MREFIGIDEARTLILDAGRLQASEQVSLLSSYRRTLAYDVRSGNDIPPFDNSAMDGFAVRIEDVAGEGVSLEVVEEIRAGDAPGCRLDPGTCVRIMTGAPLPENADAVVPIEWAVEDVDGRVRLERVPEHGQFIRMSGSDVRSGEVVAPAGVEVSPAIIGILASVGAETVEVRTEPSVAIVTTGDELVSPGEDLRPGKIRDVNGPALAAQVTSAGGRVAERLYAPDEKIAIRSVLEQALESDLVLLSGGVSVGRHDYVKEVLVEIGMETIFWKVRQRPGKPLVFGAIGAVPVLGLPGNPVSSSVCFEVYVRPLIAVMLGRRVTTRERHPAVLDEPIAKSAGLHHFVRGQAYVAEDGKLHVSTTGPQASNIYSSMVRANCLVHLPEWIESPVEGALVEVEWLTWSDR